MPRPKEPSEADIVFNRANLALAKHKRLVASWLPPLSNEEQANRKSADELEKDEEEMFAPVPEMLGLGAKQELKDGLPNRNELSELDKLRKRLLGKKAAASSQRKTVSNLTNLEPRKIFGKPVELKPEQPDDGSELEEESRAQSIGSVKYNSEHKLPMRYHQSNKRNKFEPGIQISSGKDDEDVSHKTNPDSLPKSIEGNKKRKPASFLDEVLAGKAHKKGKKNLQVSNT